MKMEKMMFAWLLIFLFITFGLFKGCGSSGGGGAPAPAAAMDTKLLSDMDLFMPRVPRFEGFLVFILNPGTPLAQNVTVTPDNGQGAPPFSFLFSGPYDGNEDGINETTLSGRATFASDPDNSWSGVNGQATIDVNIPFIGHVFHADVDYAITPTERQLSGSGTYTNALTGNTTTMTLPSATPLVIKHATGAADAVSNACGFSLDGPMQLEVTGSSGTLQSTWNFSSDSATVAVNNKTFTDSFGQSTTLPDSTVEIPCGGGKISHWVGTYDQQWACFPHETGSATISISATGPHTVAITDEDPPNSGDQSMYQAETVGNPHSLRGYFIAGPMGNRYREDFNWTLRSSLSGFAQVSSYVYTEGPKMGTGGLCVASAPRS